MNIKPATAAYLVLLFLTLAFPASRAFGQHTAPKSSLAGTWTLVLVDNVLPDGSRIHLYGAQPHGILMFDARGRYALQILSTGRPRFASNDKSKGTAEEYQAAMQGSNSHFGRYTVHDDSTITFHIEHASFPNWEGTEQKRSFTLLGDELKYTVLTPTTGGAKATGEVIWKRAP
jgi:hypothetical protein